MDPIFQTVTSKDTTPEFPRERVYLLVDQNVWGRQRQVFDCSKLGIVELLKANKYRITGPYVDEIPCPSGNLDNEVGNSHDAL
jgi:hypothetical protein